jgi:hypothetical protein
MDINQPEDNQAESDEPRNGYFHDLWNDFKNELKRAKLFLEIAAVVAGIVYTIYTIKMYRANKQAADAATKAANIAGDTLGSINLGQRAWLHLADIYVRPGPTVTDKRYLIVGKPFWTHVTFENSGQTPALYVVGHVHKVFVRTQVPQDWDGIDSVDWDKVSRASLGTINPRSTQAYSDLVILDPLSKTDYDAIKLNKLHIFVVGKLTYCDVFNPEHWATFCDQLLAAGGWAICKNLNDIEPQDKETTCSLKK